jgi:uncharacterized RDD family membrane protein YckC
VRRLRARRRPPASLSRRAAAKWLDFALFLVFAAGQAALGIRVVDLDGGPATALQLVTRALAPEATSLPARLGPPSPWPNAVATAVRAASAIRILLRAGRRALSDLLAGTKHVRDR